MHLLGIKYVKNKMNLGLTQLNINGKIIEESKDVSNHINDFFVNVGPDLDKRIPTVDHTSASKYLTIEVRLSLQSHMFHRMRF